MSKKDGWQKQMKDWKAAFRNGKPGRRIMQHVSKHLRKDAQTTAACLQTTTGQRIFSDKEKDAIAYFFFV